MPVSRLIQDILKQSRARTHERRRDLPLARLEQMAADAPAARSLSSALAAEFCVVAEHKRRSPSGGAMSDPCLARAFEVYAGRPWIKAVSVLTDLDYFDGSLQDLERARALCGVRPVLRKDFIVEEYQVVEARAFGADAILLMTTLFDEQPGRLGELLALAHSLGLEALIEVGVGEVPPDTLTDMIPAEAKIWGINSRRFSGGTRFGLRARLSRALFQLASKDMLTSLDRHRELRDLVPSGRIAVAESGIHTGADLRQTRELKYNAALVGTAFLSGKRPIEEVADEFEAALAQP